jgi:hypothetical protein
MSSCLGPSVSPSAFQHYLIVDPDNGLVIHHGRGEADVIATRIVSEGAIRLDPPGLTLEVADLLPMKAAD